MLSQIKKDMNKLHSKDNDDDSSDTEFRSKKRKKNTNKHSGAKKRKYRPKKSKYCWSSGAWNHASKDCKFKKAWHEEEATFNNMMEGSTEFFQMCL